MHGSNSSANWKPREMLLKARVMSRAKGEIHECKANQNAMLLRERRRRTKGIVLSCRQVLHR
jgi:hypothetical protein